MMLGTSSSSLLATDAAAAAAAAEGNDSGGGASGGSGEVVGGGGGTIIPGGGGGGGGFSDEENKGGGGGGGGGGNRWPRQETLALLKIRSEMGVAFRDSSLKGPLWEEVSRKMAELGYQRSSKKCKEKFENVYKYHKRTKEGRASKPDGKTYRFFEQLEALESNPNPSSSLHHHQLPPPPPPPRQQQQPPVMAAVTIQPPSANNPPPPPPSSHVNVTVSSPNPVSFSPSVVHNPIMSQLPLPSTTTNAAVATNNNNIQAAAASHHHHHHHQHSHHQHPHPNLSTTSNLLSDSTSSSSTSSDEDIGRRHNKKKRKFKDFFERLMKDVIDKQEELQRKFLETLEKRERDRMIREEAWRVQEMARMNRELDLLAQERSMAAAKDSAIMQFLQKVTGQQNLQTPTPPSISVPNTNNNYNNNNNIPPTPNPVSLPENHPSPQPISVSAPSLPVASVSPSPSMVATQIVPASSLALVSKSDNGPGGEKERENFMGSSSSSRWPKAEVQALINLRTNLDMKYQENGPKGPLWEEISAGMSKLGYSRSAKRCKEKWENINKYFKKVKESNKKRPEDSKTCPYFHQLEALYKEKAKSDHHPHHHHVSSYVSGYSTNPLKPENNNPNMVPIMARPEQQWPQEEDHESDNMDQINDHDEDDVDDDDDEDEDGSGSGGYEIVTNKTAAASSSVATTTAAE